MALRRWPVPKNEPFLWGDYERLTVDLLRQGWKGAEILDFVQTTLSCQLPPPLKCIVVCVWDPYHAGRKVQHGLVVCEQCERPVKCIEHDGHGAILANADPISILEDS